MNRAMFVASGALATSAFLIHCVSDDERRLASLTNRADPTEGGTTDSPSGQDAANVVVVADADAGGGPTCTIAEAGPPGTLDPAFENGLKPFPGGATTYATETAAIDSQGNMYVVGRVQACVSSTSGLDVAVMRLAPTGSQDVGFNNGKGYACFDFGGSESVVAAYVDADDRLVFAGRAGNDKALIGRMLPSGTLDPAFASASILMFTPEAHAEGATYTAYGISPDGAGILVSGGSRYPSEPPNRGWVLRVSENGVVDTSSFTPYVTNSVGGFRGGHVKLDGKIYLPARKAFVAAVEWTVVVLDEKGTVVGAPDAIVPSNATHRSLPQGIVVSSAAGQEDRLFVVGTLGVDPSSSVGTFWTKAGAHAGPVSTFANFFSHPDYVRTPVARQCDHKTLVAAVTAGTFRPVIARLAGKDGTLDTTWGTGGIATIPFDGGATNVRLVGVAIVGRKDGRLLVVGQTDQLDGAWVFQLLP